MEERNTYIMSVKDATAKRIENLCKQRGIAYNELANICGLTPSTIYSIFDIRRRNISLVTVKKYVMVLK